MVKTLQEGTVCSESQPIQKQLRCVSNSDSDSLFQVAKNLENVCRCLGIAQISVISWKTCKKKSVTYNLLHRDSVTYTI